MKFAIQLIKKTSDSTHRVIKVWDIPKIEIKNLGENSRNTVYSKGRIKVKFLPTLADIKQAIVDAIQGKI